MTDLLTGAGAAAVSKVKVSAFRFVSLGIIKWIIFMTTCVLINQSRRSICVVTVLQRPKSVTLTSILIFWYARNIIFSVHKGDNLLLIV